jgi:UDP-N-acetylmuramoyl-tripeptide--D-alanyl-D-alanine ligase
MYFLLNIFWFVRTAKYILFWLYLWQLKEYHVGRFIDHFHTEKGKKLILDPIQILKFFILLLWIFARQFFSIWFVALIFIYLFELLLFGRQIFLKSFKRPVKTPKTILLLSICCAVAIIFLFFAPIFWLLVFDILTPIIVSIIILLTQPVFVFLRNRILKKAEEKIKQFNNLKVIAITGSYGKTSTKEFLSAILSEKFKVIKTKEHQNSEIGIAKCILNDLNENHEIFIAEVGAYNKGKVKEVCKMLQPRIGIVTGINEQHLSLFGSMENLLLAEGGRELAQVLPKNGLLILNGDNKYCLDLYKKASNPENKKVYSVNRAKINSNIWADDITITKHSIDFLAIAKTKETMHFKANVLGKQNVQNLLAAILTAKELGMSFGQISEACRNIKPEFAGMVLKQGKHGIEIIDSSYSANPDGVAADLEYLNLFEQKKIIVMPCLIELGKKSSEIHEKIGQKIGKICDLAIITTKEKFIDIKKGAVYAGMAKKNIVFCENPQNIYSMITLFCKKGDAVLLEGRVPQKLINLIAE